MGKKTKLVILVAFVIGQCYSQKQISTVKEKTVVNAKNLHFRNNKERCVSYLNSQLGYFLRKIEKPTKEVHIF